MALTDKLTAIANAIRAKTGGSSTLTLPQMAQAIDALNPPPVEEKNVNFYDFKGIPATAQFLVANQEMYDVFTTATNWSTYASKFAIKGV